MCGQWMMSSFTGLFLIGSVMICGMLAEDAADNPFSNICPRGFITLPNDEGLKNPAILQMCYKFFNVKYTFEEAVNKCEEINSTLATPKHDVDAEVLANYIIKHKPKYKRYWIGLSDQVEEGTFRWEDDDNVLRSNFSSWMFSEPESNAEAEPGSRGSEQDCVKMAIWVFGARKSTKFFDTHCEKVEAFICEKVPNKRTMLPSSSIRNLTERVEAPDNSSSETTSETPVAFVAPENYKNYLQKNKSMSAEKERRYPIKVISYGEGFDEEGVLEMNGTSNNGSDDSTAVGKFENKEPMVKLKMEKIQPSNGTRIDRRKQVEPRNCNLQCSANYMRAVCPLKYFPQMQNTRVVLNNASCRPRRNKTHLIVHTSLDDCGTTVQNAIKEEKVSFRNTIQLIPKGSGIVRNSQVASGLTEIMILDCRYPQHHSVSQIYHPAEGRPQVYRTTMYGPSLNHVMLLYKTIKYDCPYAREEYPVKLPLSQRVYLEVTLDMASERMELHPVTCFATPDANPFNSNNYVLMQDGCVEDNTFRLEKQGSSKVSRFSIEAFRFVGYFRKVFIHCKVVVCKLNSESSPSCPYACNQESRYKRDTQGEPPEAPKQFTSHSGMIDIVDDDYEPLEQSKERNQLIDSIESKQQADPQALLSRQNEENTNQEDKGENSGANISPSILTLVIVVLCSWRSSIEVNYKS